MTADGSVIAGAGHNSYWVSTDSGATWTRRSPMEKKYESRIYKTVAFLSRRIQHPSQVVGCIHCHIHTVASLWSQESASEPVSK